MTLYPKNSDKMLSPELFKNPTSEYRGAPFWAWNCELDLEYLFREIEYLKEMGMGGFHIHSRTGMSTKYLSDEFMNFVRKCNKKAKDNNMLCWLYDEDRWPSGSAGGYVTKDLRFRSRYLKFTLVCEDEKYKKDKDEFDRCIDNDEKPKGYFIAKYQVKLQDGYLTQYKRLEKDEEAEADFNVWWAYLELAEESPWFNNQAYVNTLDSKAIEKFVQITHERYYSILKDDFGKSIHGIFTDEPQFHHKECFKFPNDLSPVVLPYTDDFPDTYKAFYGEDILDYLPELFWELPEGKVSVARYQYHDHLSERFSSAFADTVGNWCDNHGVMLTGHMMDEHSLRAQTAALGEAMRSYRAFKQPGIDMLCDWREFDTAKQAQSASRQYGCPGVTSELYGVTNWDFDFKGHKLAGDWQAALGVTLRVHHLSWVSMAGESKRDYPAAIGYQSPWFREYSLIEDHFSRVNTALTRGKASVKVGVIHPIESYWLHWGPMIQTEAVREELESNFQNIIEWLLFGLIDFDFISESLLPELCDKNAGNPMKVGEMEYDVIIVPGCHTLRASTVQRLKSFKERGGKLIFVGEVAKLVDARKSNKVEELTEKSITIPFSKRKILDEVNCCREVDVVTNNGIHADNLFYQMRNDGDCKWLFICHVNDVKNGDILKQIFNEEQNSAEEVKIIIKGLWKVTMYNTINGTIYPQDAYIDGNSTVINYTFYPQDSILLLLEAGVPDNLAKNENTSKAFNRSYILSDKVPITLSEPNVLLLDIAEYSFDDGPWQNEEEILRIDNIFRTKLGFRNRTDGIEQPWVNQCVDAPKNYLNLKFNINSKIKVEAPSIALENVETTDIVFNGRKVEKEINGWYVDETIKKVKLPPIEIGSNEITLKIPFGAKTNVEWCYLLGEFGVEVRGKDTEIVEVPKTLFYGNWVNQRLPFYAGNVTYHCTIESKGENIKLQIPLFKSPVISVELDGIKKGRIAFEPYILDLGYVEKGKHILDITCFGNRVNTFGCVHNCISGYKWFGPNAWRTTGNGWSDQYQLKPMGILTNPLLLSE